MITTLKKGLSGLVVLSVLALVAPQQAQAIVTEPTKPDILTQLKVLCVASAIVACINAESVDTLDDEFREAVIGFAVGQSYPFRSLKK